MQAILTRDLCKSYGRRPVLHNLDLCVPTGSLFGFLGPNGAGKTTTIRILLGLLRANGGDARILDRNVWTDGPRVRSRIGYLPGDIRLYDNLTGRATLTFFAAARRRQVQTEIKRLADRFDLELDKRVRDYSRGMKQKLGLLQALMHRPELVILDEPTIALDPLVRRTLFEELRAVAADGRTVFFSSHTLSEVEGLCDRVAILRDGRLIEQNQIDVLRARAIRRVEILFESRADRSGTVPVGLTVLHQDNRRLEGAWVGPIAPLLRWLAQQPARDATIAPPDLEHLFMAYYSAGEPKDRP